MGELKVKTISLRALEDEFLKKQRFVDLAKVDIEGGEIEFLASNKADLMRIKALVVELHPNVCNSSDLLAVLLDSFDNVENIGGRTSAKPMLFCMRSNHEGDARSYDCLCCDS
jgi:hypothetical protein